jgi:hypothetical protein
MVFTIGTMIQLSIGVNKNKSKAYKNHQYLSKIIHVSTMDLKVTNKKSFKFFGIKIENDSFHVCIICMNIPNHNF